MQLTSESTDESQVGSLEQNLRKGAEHVTDVEGAVAGFGKQLATFKQACFESSVISLGILFYF